MAIKNVLFDWDNTLLNTSEYKELSKHAIIIGMQSEATEKFKIKLSRKLLEETMDAIRKEKGTNYNKLIDDTASIICRRLGINDQLKIDRIAVAGISAHHKTKYAYFAYLYNEVIDTLISLREIGMRIGIATAGITHKQIDKINWASLNRLIDDIFVTDQYITETGIKQSIDIKTKEYFEWIASKLNKSVSEIIMVGDNYSNDIEPAKDAGLITVHINRKCNSEIKGAKADYQIEDLMQVVDIVTNLNKS